MSSLLVPQRVALELRVCPAPSGLWRVEGRAGHVLAVHRSPQDAAADATRRVEEAGGGEVVVLDAYLRVRRVLRVTAP